MNVGGRVVTGFVRDGHAQHESRSALRDKIVRSRDSFSRSAHSPSLHWVYLSAGTQYLKSYIKGFMWGCGPCGVLPYYFSHATPLPTTIAIPEYYEGLTYNSKPKGSITVAMQQYTERRTSTRRETNTTLGKAS